MQKAQTSEHDPNRPRNKAPLPNAKKFTSEYQPSPQAKSEGIRRKSLMEHARQMLESQLQEAEKAGTLDIKTVEALKAEFGGDKVVANILNSVAIRYAVKGDKGWAEWLRKSAYGDKIEVTGDVEVKHVLPFDLNEPMGNRLDAGVITDQQK